MKQEHEERIRALLAQMTLEEKVGQLNLVCPSIYGAFDTPESVLLEQLREGIITAEELETMRLAEPDYRENDIRAGRVGMHTTIGREATHRLQKIAVEESRLGIPILFGRDVIHGYRTVTPIPLAESCSFDDELWEQTARMSAKEAAYDGINLTYSPMVDVSKDARWGRIAESAGEDTLMNARYGAAKVRGYQTDDPAREDAIAACCKHFCAYGFCESGRDYNRVELSEQRLREDVLPPFQACVEAGVLSIMPSFNDICGVPSSVNGWLLRDVLRGEWGFTGTTISDANAIAECIAHGVCANGADAAKQSLEAGMDIDMASGCYPNHLAELVSSGAVDEAVLDAAVADVLRLKLALGLFENPYGIVEEDPQPFLKPEYRALARRAAQESIVLLKNNGVLPLKKDMKLAVLGKLADARGEMSGTWALDSQEDDFVSLMDGLRSCGAAAQLYHCVAQAQDEDVILLALGEGKTESGEGASKTSISLSQEQRALVRSAAASGKKLVAVLFNGRPLVLDELLGCADAIVEAWQLGVEAGNAVADVLFGAYNPSGKLTATFPRAVGACPCYYDHTTTGRPATAVQYTSRYLDQPIKPAFPFGWGLSYTSFSYAAPAVRKEADAFVLSVRVKNTGARDGVEVAQCYFRDVVAKRTRPVRRLAAYARVPLAAGEEKTLEFTIPFDRLGYYDARMNWLVEAGEYVFMVGGNSEDCLSVTVTL